MSIDEKALYRLEQLGRREGFVTLQQIKDALPVEAMNEADIGETIERLEAAGITVEADLSLSRRHRPEPEPDVTLPVRPRTAAGGTGGGADHDAYDPHAIRHATVPPWQRDAMVYGSLALSILGLLWLSLSVM